MKRALSFLAVLYLFFFTSCQKEQRPIEYPENGLSGPNILAANRTVYPENVSLEADLGESNQLRVVIKGVTSYTFRDTISQLPNGQYQVMTRHFGLWSYWSGHHNLFVSNMDFQDPFSQQMQSIDASGKVLMRMMFDPGYEYLIEIYENGAEQPTRVKRIQVE